ncbi:hypothetical protein CAC42_2508 [Sphaceloma murrayae]|uniref:Uncharacterized protein n=1 Tax=Sphaceloma murrayae TaxID=2082308 RepID=A0A2K1QWA7_9PEZI|nr:hypothetical protein CAC42_2508 [Sphaceloma murrayae]
MKSSAARHFTQFTNKIHPQVALTRTESQRLLDSLKTSFRQHLDAEHDATSRQTASVSPAKSLSYTERHVASVLTNPLLATPPRRDHSDTISSRHPIEIFNECVARGTATYNIANQCLSAFHRMLASSSPAGRQEAILKHRPGTKILQWLWANDLARADVFTSGQRLASSVTALLLREGREESVWSWLDVADQGTDPHYATGKQVSSPQATLLNHIVYWRSKSRDRHLGPALDTFMKAVARVRTHAFPTASLALAGNYIISESLKQRNSLVSDSVRVSILKFIESFDLWKQGYLEPHAIDMARMKLQHLGSAGIDQTLDLIAGLEIESAQLSKGQYGTKVVKLLLALSETLQESGTREQVRRFVGYIEGLQDDREPNEESVLMVGLRCLPELLLRDVQRWASTSAAQPQIIPS